MAQKLSAKMVLLAAVAIVGLTPTPSSAHSDLTLVNFGGSAARAQMLALLRPWEKETGSYATMEEYNGGAAGIAEIRRQVEAANVTWDVVDMEYSDLIQACDEGLLEKIDMGSLPAAGDGTAASDDFRDGALHECGVGNLIWSTVYAFNGDQFAFPPSTIADFFNTESFPGKRGVRRDPRGILEWALIADGVATAQVYEVLGTPDGLDRAFDKLASIRSEIVWWERGPQPAQLLEDEAVSMSMAWNGRLFRPIVEEGRDIRIVWDGQIWEYDLFAIPKGARNLEAAKDFIRYATSTDKLAEWTTYISYGPARKSSAAKVSPEMEPLLPTSEANLGNALRFDSGWWAENIDRIRPRFDRLTSPDFGTEGAQSGRF
ncbi:ABC transporter substrate-binding protein [Ruegeria sp.]|uniref:ABC transporter substrate-binding protein n=1 Tax=Ruegeria sp. TaxID=1879320 RepID=UPI00230F91D0|nr:ABC transporter substrate-binding protein [Ruegeria sp.]MDA7963617.1 ABC transporter substrate-binding protein [Ruegeria sp.]